MPLFCLPLGRRGGVQVPPRVTDHPAHQEYPSFIYEREFNIDVPLCEIDMVRCIMALCQLLLSSSCLHLHVPIASLLSCDVIEAHCYRADKGAIDSQANT